MLSCIGVMFAPHGLPRSADDPERIAALDDDLIRLADDALAGSSTMQWEYLVTVARKR